LFSKGRERSLNHKKKGGAEIQAWVSISEAAALLGVTPRLIYKQIKENALPAKPQKSRGRGGKTYLVALSSLPPPAQEKWVEARRRTIEKAREAAARAGQDDQPPEVTMATLAEIEAKYSRQDYRRKVDEALRRQAVAVEAEKLLAEKVGKAVKKIADAHGLSEKTVYKWRRRYKEGGLAALMDRRVARPGPGAGETCRYSIDPKAKEFMIALYLQENQPTMGWCYDRTVIEAEKNGWRMCSRATAYRILGELREDVKVYGREGEKKFQNRLMVKCQRDTESLQPNQVVMSDHHHCDFFINYGGKAVRPWLTVFFDVFSRCPTGWVFSIQPNSEILAMGFRHAVLPKPDFPFEGLMAVLYVDNGEDYKSRHFKGIGKRVCVDFTPETKGIVEGLGIEIIHSLAYWAWSKAQVERFFGTFADRFSRFQPGWCGRKKEERPPDLDKRLPKMLAEGKLPTIDKIEQEFVQWLKHDYLNKVHRTLKTTPLLKYQSKQPVRPGRVPAEKLEHFLLKAEKRAVTSQGIHFFNHLYYAPELQPLEGKKVTIRYDSNRIGEIYVYYRGRRICAAQNRKLIAIGANSKDLEEHRKEQARHTRAVREIVQGYRRKLADIAKDEQAKGPRAVAGAVLDKPADGKVVELIRAPKKQAEAGRGQRGQLAREYLKRVYRENEGGNDVNG
ncbi:MAG: Mu transposase C-terminal domain-containing protein, partial [Deltaproteobacteria bacterium]|nr:Mu transposase C-terminal domain-containing protein [Deltaproteobacteria bacterium]